jgi:hypothetical protein
MHGSAASYVFTCSFMSACMATAEPEGCATPRKQLDHDAGDSPMAVSPLAASRTGSCDTLVGEDDHGDTSLSRIMVAVDKHDTHVCPIAEALLTPSDHAEEQQERDDNREVLEVITRHNSSVTKAPPATVSTPLSTFLNTLWYGNICTGIYRVQPVCGSPISHVW